MKQSEGGTTSFLVPCKRTKSALTK